METSSFLLEVKKRGVGGRSRHAATSFDTEAVAILSSVPGRELARGPRRRGLRCSRPCLRLGPAEEGLMEHVPRGSLPSDRTRGHFKHELFPNHRMTLFISTDGGGAWRELRRCLRN